MRFDVCSYFFAKNLALGENFFLSPTLNIIQPILYNQKRGLLHLSVVVPLSKGEILFENIVYPLIIYMSIYQLNLTIHYMVGTFLHL